MCEPNAAGRVRQRLIVIAVIGAPVLLALGSLLAGVVDGKADTVQATAGQLTVAAPVPEPSRNNADVMATWDPGPPIA